MRAQRGGRGVFAENEAFFAEILSVGAPSSCLQQVLETIKHDDWGQLPVVPNNNYT